MKATVEKAAARTSTTAAAVTHETCRKIPNQTKTRPQYRDLAQVARARPRDGKVYGNPFTFDSIGLIYDTTLVSPSLANS